MRQITPRARWWPLVLLAASAAAGCGGGNVTVYPVKGKVNFEGKAMRGGGAISLVPLSKQEGKAAGGEIAEDGSFQLTTYKPGDGSMAGEFRVVIHQSVFKEPESSRDGEKAARAAEAVAPADRIPTIYSDPQNSPLKAKVEAGKPNELNLELKRDAGPPPVRGARGAGGARDPVVMANH
jgi:hypothetical protein